jgi:hypothetical protein
MKKLAFVLLLLTTPAWAEWTRVDVNEDSDAYIDLATIGRRGNIVKVWVLFDYKTNHQWSELVYWSLKTQREYDCDGKRHHTLNSLFHSERMGGGESVYTVPGGTSWGPVPPDSIDEVLWTFACKQ